MYICKRTIQRKNKIIIISPPRLNTYLIIWHSMIIFVTVIWLIFNTLYGFLHSQCLWHTHTGLVELSVVSYISQDLAKVIQGLLVGWQTPSTSTVPLHYKWETLGKNKTFEKTSHTLKLEWNKGRPSSSRNKEKTQRLSELELTLCL